MAVLFAVICACVSATRADDVYIVEAGKARAEIVIAEQPRRTTRVAAGELRRYVEKITGARLPIVDTPSENLPVKLFVGRSAYADELGVTEEGLEHGAYRIVSGDSWLVLIGDDTEFVPREPWARNNRDRASGKLQRAWERITGEPFGVPNGGMYKNRAKLPGDTGLPDDAETRKDETLTLWGFDERGSFNAVCGFLRSLGVRWYMPGELGEVVPKSTSIRLPRIDRTVRPDFEVRQFNARFGTLDHDVMMWCMRLGMRNPYGLMIAHGMHTMTHTDTILREHPDWFALYGGKRDTKPGERLNHLCYSNKELFDATVRWARAQFDVYGFESVSIMPPDAYIAICQCTLCEGKDVPEMGARGKLSNHVWDFVNRVAAEVRKTHPDRKVVCCAYGANTAPPTNIDKLEPNVQVIIVGGRRPRNSRPEQREAIRELRAGWIAKTDNPLMIFENYPFTSRGFYLPAFVPRTIGRSINTTKGVARGEDIWLSFPRRVDTGGIAFDAFQVYFTARMYWGGKDRDVDAMLEEHCRLFYGPAGPTMQRFFEYCEANWQDMEHDKTKVDTALGLFDDARARVTPQSAYAKRLAVMAAFLESLRSKAALLAQKRGPVPKLRMVWEPKEPIVIDGKLDDQYWRECPTSSRGALRELQTGRRPIFGTTVMAGWHRGSLYFGIRCEERSGEKLNIATTKNEDQSMWYGDVVEIELGTDSHSYYQIAVNPSGAIVDLDRGVDKNAWFRWQSQAEVATHVAGDHWTVEIRIPVTEDDNDPLNQVIGRKPSQSLPWHFNVCRQRIRDNGSEYSAFSPTGTAGFHEPMKFAHLYDGRSHRFDADPTVNDYFIAGQAAEALMRRRKYRDAVAAYVEMAEAKGATALQRADALSRASRGARAMDDIEHADQLADRVPIDAVAKTVRMENLSARRDWNAVIERFGDEDLRRWPFWQIGAGAYVRGRAFHAAKLGDRAEADLQLALAFTSDSHTRLKILGILASNREFVLKDDDAALRAYRRIADSTTHTGSADYYRGVLGASRILSRRGEHDEAIATLRRLDLDKLRGYWRGAMHRALGDVLRTAGRSDEAIATYQQALGDGASGADRKAAESAIEALRR